MAATSSDKALLGGAALLALASAGVFGWMIWRVPRAASAPPPQVTLADAPYKPIAPDAPPIKTETWNAPVAQTRGREWIYDTFTPPEIFYNARSKQFTVKPPSSLVDEDPNEVFGLDLVAVRPEPFRLQLFGYVGDEGKLRGMFQNMETGETVVATGGHKLPKLGLTIQKLELTRQPIAIAESTSTRQRVAIAVVHDERSNRDVMLTHRERVFTGTLSAFVANTGETATREVRQGDVFKIGEATYRIDKIQLTPPTVEITKESPTLTQPDRRTLTPREPDAPETSDKPEPLGGSS